MSQRSSISPEQLQVLYELSLSIGQGKTLADVARTALSSYLRRLNCSAGAIFRRQETAAGQVSYERVDSIPKNPTQTNSFDLARDCIPSGETVETDTAFQQALPKTGQNGSSHYHLFDLPGFGVLLLIRSDAPLPRPLRSELRPLNRKLAAACRHRLAKQSVQQARQTLRNIIDLLPQHVFAKDTAGRFLLANQSFADAYGVTVEEVEGNTEADFSTLTRSTTRHDAEDRAVIETGNSKHVPEESFTMADGRERTVETVKIPYNPIDTNGDAVLGVATDITEQKKREQELEETNTLLQTVLDNLPAGILVEGPERNIQSVNQRLLDLFERTGDPETLVGTECEAALENLKHTLANPDEFLERVNDVVDASERVEKQELALADGRKFEWDYVPYRVEAGNSNLWMYRDVTAQANREAELRETRRELRASNQELEQFAYAASHDLKEPLRSVSNYLTLFSDLYDEGETLDAQAYSLIGNAVDAAGRMQSMINALLQYSRVETTDSETERISLDTVFEKTKLNLTVPIDDAGATVTAESLPTVAGDQQLLVQLFQNIVHNGIKYNDSEHPRVHVGLETGDTTVPGDNALDDDTVWHHLYCEDNGVGMEANQADQAFDVFERLGRDDGDGTGMGLTLSQRIVSDHDGAIWIESTPGDGTIVHLCLPASV